MDEMVYHSHWFERLWMKWFTVHIGLSVVDEMVYPSHWFERCG